MSSLPFKVKAVYEYSSPHDDDLNFPLGQMITVTEEEDAEWYIGEYTDASGVKHDGLFPKNFVEKYEPEAPPRPTRTRPKKETSAATPQAENTASASAANVETSSQAVETAPVASESFDEPNVETAASLPPSKPVEKPTPPVQSTSAKAVPPPVAEKPSSFKDRIAAFNKTSAQPVAPVKPGPSGGTGSSFIKKPFVAPPPSRNAYVPPPTREVAPQKIYRREEDPEIAERQAQDQQDAEIAGLASTETQEGEEEAVRPTSLRDRIALLQKQQQEQAARRAEVSQKEKPKRPAKKRTESGDQIAVPAQDDSVDVEEPNPELMRQSTDLAREVPKPPVARKTSRDPRSPTQDISDGNEADQSGAGDTTEEAEAEETEVDDQYEKPKTAGPLLPPRTSTTSSMASGGVPTERVTTREVAEEPEEAEEEEDDEEEEEEEEIDEETRKKAELRERMAKMSGGMGMPGMFAMPTVTGPTSKKSRPSASSEQREDIAREQAAATTSQVARAPPVPVHGMPTIDLGERQIEVERESEVPASAIPERDPEEVADVEDLEPESGPGMTRADGGIASSAPQGRPVPPASASGTRAPPPPVPSARSSTQQPIEARPAPPPPPRPAQSSPGPGSESDDELPPQQRAVPPPPQKVAGESSTRGIPPPVPKTPTTVQKPEGPRSPPASSGKFTTYFDETGVSQPPSSPPEKSSRTVPPVPSSPPTLPPGPPTDIRPPPPPPPTAAPPSRQSTGLEQTARAEDDTASGGESEYEGDYDTDIAAGATHKNALKSHAREPSLDESILSDPTSSPVPPPSTRAIPPLPPPHQAAVEARPSVDAPRAPPPVPPSRDAPGADDDGEYDPYRYTSPTRGVVLPTHHKARIPSASVQASDQPIEAGNVGRSPPPPPQSPPLVAHGVSAPPPRPSRDSPRQSVEMPRQSLNVPRKSTEQPRLSVEQGQIAQDVDLAVNTLWWASPNTPPPVFQDRGDVRCEFEESSTSKRGGRTTISKDVYILFHDYSQTIVTALFDSKNPADVTLEQRHEPPPPRLRQDQLEAAHARFGQTLSAAAASKQNQTVGNGSGQSLVMELLQGQANALMPIGTRAYGALVYANMANATVQQFDEIRPGDIISFRNAKFSGKHGAMHAKYSEDVGKPEHVGVVTEWDGTKKKVRALEQGRESKKAKVESFRVGDLRSGEVKVWRVMGRDWVGWESS